jgi:hypothetical protein
MTCFHGKITPKQGVPTHMQTVLEPLMCSKVRSKWLSSYRVHDATKTQGALKDMLDRSAKLIAIQVA